MANAVEKAGLGIMVGFLGTCAVIQMNDPDALLWMVVYGLPALVTLAALISGNAKGSMWWLTTCWVVFTAELAFSITVITDSIQAKQVRWNLFATEEGRESTGLIIVLIWLLILICTSSRSREENYRSRNIVLSFSLVSLASCLVYKYFIQSSINLPEHCTGIL